MALTSDQHIEKLREILAWIDSESSKNDVIKKYVHGSMKSMRCEDVAKIMRMYTSESYRYSFLTNPSTLSNITFTDLFTNFSFLLYPLGSESYRYSFLKEHLLTRDLTTNGGEGSMFVKTIDDPTRPGYTVKMFDKSAFAAFVKKYCNSESYRSSMVTWYFQALQGYRVSVTGTCSSFIPLLGCFSSESYITSLIKSPIASFLTDSPLNWTLFLDYVKSNSYKVDLVKFFTEKGYRTPDNKKEEIEVMKQEVEKDSQNFLNMLTQHSGSSYYGGTYSSISLTGSSVVVDTSSPTLNFNFDGTSLSRLDNGRLVNGKLTSISFNGVDIRYIKKEGTAPGYCRVLFQNGDMYFLREPGEYHVDSSKSTVHNRAGSKMVAFNPLITDDTGSTSKATTTS